jgi:ABC-2 type transport system permease protein
MTISDTHRTPVASSTSEHQVSRVEPNPPAVRSGDDVAAVTNAVASEWTKVRSLRSNWAILAGTAAVGIVIAWALAVFVKTDTNTGETFTVGSTFIYSTWLSAVLAIVAGTLIFTSEVQHGTLPGAVTAQPMRWVTVAAKSAIAAVFGLAMGFVGMIAGLSGAVLGGLEGGDTSGMPTTAAWGLMLTTVAAIFGLGVGMIIRHSSAAISITLVWAFVLENLFRAFAPPTVSRFLPFSAANGLLDIEPTTDPQTLAVALTRIQDALLFSSYTLVAIVIGTLLLYRRDTI